MVALALGMPDTGGTTCAKEDGLITARDASEYVLATIPGNPEHCSAYGGCHFRDRCPEANSLVAIGSLFRKHESKGDIMSSSMDDLKARLNAKMNADAAPAAAAPDAAPAVQADPAATLPPDAPPRESTAAEVEAANAPANPAVAKPKRGRPPKAAQAQAAPPAPSEDATPAAPSPPATASLAVLPGAHGTPQAAEPAAPRKGPRVLYINTRPVRGKDIEATYTPAWDIWMSDLLLQLHTELKVLDYRLVEYGKGKGALTAFIKARLETAPEVCIVRTSHPEAHDFLAVAIPMAQDVIGW
jgi:hypothetical protein